MWRHQDKFTYVYIYIYMRSHAYKHQCTHINIHEYTRQTLFVYMHQSIYKCMHRPIHNNAIYTDTHWFTEVRKHTHTRILNVFACVNLAHHVEHLEPQFRHLGPFGVFLDVAPCILITVDHRFKWATIVRGDPPIGVINYGCLWLHSSNQLLPGKFEINSRCPK